MPGTTTTFGIPFPCEGDLPTIPALTSYAMGVEAALSTVWTDANDALQPPAVAVQNTASQSIVAGATTTLTYNSEFYDRGNMWNAGSPTIVTIPTAGSYFIASTGAGNLAGNVTSVRWAILRNGVELAYWENQNTGALIPVSSLDVSVLAVACVPGDQITTTILYTGAATPLNFFGRLNVTRLSIF